MLLDSGVRLTEMLEEEKVLIFLKHEKNKHPKNYEKITYFMFHCDPTVIS